MTRQFHEQEQVREGLAYLQGSVRYRAQREEIEMYCQRDVMSRGGLVHLIYALTLAMYSIAARKAITITIHQHFSPPQIVDANHKAKNGTEALSTETRPSCSIGRYESIIPGRQPLSKPEYEDGGFQSFSVERIVDRLR